MEIQKFNHRYSQSSLFGFKESRFVFQSNPENRPSLQNLLEAGASGINNLANAAASLILVVTDLVQEGSGLLTSGIAGIKIGASRMTRWAEREWGGAGPLDPKMTSLLIKEVGVNGARFNLVRTNNNVVNHILDCDLYAHFLQFKKAEISALYLPQIQCLKDIADEIDTRERIEFKTRSRREWLEEEIFKLEGLVGDPAHGRPGTYREGSGLKANDSQRLAGYRKELNDYNKAIDTNVMWEVPQVVEKEFPPGSGEYVKAYVPGNTKKKVDIKALSVYLKAHVSSFLSKMGKGLKVLNKEEEKYIYRRELALSELETASDPNKDDMLESVHTNSKAINAQYRKAIVELAKPDYFPEKNTPAPVTYLIKGESSQKKQRDLLRRMIDVIE